MAKAAKLFLTENARASLYVLRLSFRSSFFLRLSLGRSPPNFATMFGGDPYS